MPNLMQAAVETSSENTNGVCTVLYFDGAANRENIEEGLRYVASHRSDFPAVGTNAPLVVADHYLSYKELVTDFSTRSGWHRYECYGSC